MKGDYRSLKIVKRTISKPGYHPETIERKVVRSSGVAQRGLP